jgi:hypothetical protein
MTDILISLDEQQLQRLEQIVLDHDEVGAIRFLEELRRKIKRRNMGCNPMEFKAREGIEEVIDDAKKQI